MKYSTDIVVIDLEATCLTQGANEVHQSAIIEIAAVRLDKKTLNITASFAELVKPRDIPLTPEITAITAITPEMLEGCDAFDKVGTRFVEWFGNRNRATLAAFGVYYDIPLLRKEFGSFGLDFRSAFVGTALDIRALAMAWRANNEMSTTGVTIEGTLEKMGISLGVGFHRALADAKAAAAILQVFHFGRVVSD